MTHWPLANIEIEGRGESFILAALAGLLGHAGFLPSTVSFNGVVVKASRSDAVYHNCGVGRAEEVSGGTRCRALARQREGAHPAAEEAMADGPCNGRGSRFSRPSRSRGAGEHADRGAIGRASGDGGIPSSLADTGAHSEEDRGGDYELASGGTRRGYPPQLPC